MDETLPVLRFDWSLPPEERGVEIELAGFVVAYVSAEEICAAQHGYLPLPVLRDDGSGATAILHVGYEEGGCGLNDTPAWTETEGEDAWPVLARVIVDTLRTDPPDPGVTYAHSIYCRYCSRTAYTLRDTGVRLPRQGVTSWGSP
jgi:hypothetical protein